MNKNVKFEIGLRLEGVLKSSDGQYPLISFVTATYNDASKLEDTIKSIIALNYPNIEHIVIDGNSSDNTREILVKYKSNIDYAISEDDQGVYDAMNKGIKYSKGKWINFLNSGDKILHLNQYDLINLDTTYTNFYYDEEKKYILRRPLTKLFLTRNMPCHQSIIYHRDEIIEYSLDYPIIADFIQILKILNQIKNEGIVGSSIFYYNIPGISHEYASKNGLALYKQLEQRSKYILKYLGLFYYFVAKLHTFRIMLKRVFR